MQNRSHPGLNPQLLMRPMLPSDLDSVIRIEELSFPQPWTREQFIDEMRRGSVSWSYVATVGDVESTRYDQAKVQPAPIAGFIMGWLVADELHITNIAVDPEWRRCGIAASLLDKSLHDAVQAGAVWCQLEVRVSNKPARCLYEHFGFKKMGIRKGYYNGGEDAVVMGKNLEVSI